MRNPCSFSIMGLLQNMIISVVEESAEGVLEPDVATDVVKPLADAKPPNLLKKLIENPEMSGSLSPEDPIIGPDDGSFEIPVAVKGSGKSGVAPEAGVLYKNIFGKESIPTGGTVDDVSTTPTTTEFTVDGSNFAENDTCLVAIDSSWEGRWITDVVEGTGEQTITVWPALSQAPVGSAVVKPGVIYKPSSDEDDFKSMSTWYYLDGIRLGLAGNRGNVAFEFPWGDVPKAKFSMQLMTWAESNADCGYDPEYDGAKPFICQGGSFQRDGAEEYIEKFALDLGWKISKIGAIQATGWYDIFNSKREPSGSFDPFATSVAHLTAWKNQTPGTIFFQIGDHTNLVLMRLPRITRREVKFGDKEGVNIYDITYAASKTVKDDEVFLSFLSSVDP